MKKTIEVMGAILIVAFIVRVCYAASLIDAGIDPKITKTDETAVLTIDCDIPFTVTDGGTAYEIPRELRGTWLTQVETETAGGSEVEVTIMSGYNNMLFYSVTTGGTALAQPSAYWRLTDKAGDPPTVQVDGISTGTTHVVITGSIK